jgi:hypothetical protein
VEGKYRLVDVLRRLHVSDRHIRLTLVNELGLTPEEADQALARSTGPPTTDSPSPEDDA